MNESRTCTVFESHELAVHRTGYRHASSTPPSPSSADSARLMDAAQYTPLPDDWTVGIADVVQSTKAIAEKRYKAVNMAGAAVIAALTNALGGREFPFVFGGDGASFAVSPRDAEIAREALAATAAWAGSELGLTLRVALIPTRRRSRARRRRAGGALCAVGEFVLCDVFRRRAGLGRRRGEARRVRRRPRPARRRSRILGPISPACPAASRNSAPRRA